MVSSFWFRNGRSKMWTSSQEKCYSEWKMGHRRRRRRDQRRKGDTGWKGERKEWGFRRKNSTKDTEREKERKSQEQTQILSQIVNQTANNNDKKKNFSPYISTCSSGYFFFLQMFTHHFQYGRSGINSMIIIITPSGKYSECHLQFFFLLLFFVFFRIKGMKHVSLWWRRKQNQFDSLSSWCWKHRCNSVARDPKTEKESEKSLLTCLVGRNRVTQHCLMPKKTAADQTKENNNNRRDNASASMRKKATTDLIINF